MKAAFYRSYGAARDVLEFGDMPDPRPGPGEVVVDLAFSGVNPSDVKARAGARAGATDLPFSPIIPHSDGAGTISATGDGVAQDRLGQQVWVWNGQWRRANGTAATKIALPEAQAVPLPDGIGLATGASLGIPGLTAGHVVFSGGEIRDQTVLIHGGAGTVGFLAVQLARWGGARVIATASPPNVDRVKDAGACAVLDYSDPDLAAQILDANAGNPVTRIIDPEFGENAQTNAHVIAENGRINAYGSAHNMTPELPFYSLMFKSVTLEMALVYILTHRARAGAIDRLHRALTQGALTCPVHLTVPLPDISTAHECVEEGRRKGSVLIDMAAP